MSNARKLGNMTTHGLDGDFNVDPTDNTLVVDSTNNRVGIGSATPTTTLDITGTATATAFSGPLTGNVTGTTSSISNHDTDALSEGSTNLYFTNARADARAQLKIDALVDSAPGTLDTLNELAAALGDDANFSTTITNSIATKLPLAGGTVTGELNVDAQLKANQLRLSKNGDSTIIGATIGLSNAGGDTNSNDITITASNSTNSIVLRSAINIDTQTYQSGSWNSRLKILQNGNVGIGTTSPNDKLHIQHSDTGTYSASSLATGMQVSRKNSSNTTNQAVTISLVATGWEGITTGLAGISAVQPSNTSSADLVFQNRSGGGYQENMRIKYDGKVGIGTPTPGDELTVVGQALFSYTDIAANSSAQYAQVEIQKDDADANWSYLAFHETGSIAWQQGILDNKFVIASTGGVAKTSTDAEHFTIDTSGNVGIGTTSPGQKFQVYIDNSNDLEYGYRDGLIIDRLSDENMDDASASVPADRYWPQGNLKLTDGNVFSSDSNGPGLSFYKHRDNTGNEYVQAFIGSRGVFGSNNTDLRFYVNSANAANLLPTSPQMLISGANGYVGIGTTTPGAGLEVYGAGSNDRIAIKYSGTAGGHQSGIIFKDFRNQVNAAVFNNLQNDGVGTAAANLELHTSTGSTLSPRIKIFHNGRVAIGDITPDAPLHVNGAAIIGGNNNQSTSPIAGLHVLDSAYSGWSTTLSKQQVALRVETLWNSSNGTRAVGTYGGGIGFNHLGGHSTTHDENLHCWIGPRVVSTPNHETSALVFATNNDVNDEDAGILERASISPEGRFTFKQYSTNASQIHNSVGYTDLYKFSFSMNMFGNQAYVVRTSGHGNGIMRIMAQGSHWSSPYGLWRESYLMLDSSSTMSESNMHNQTSSQQGSWSFSRHSASEVDIVKAAGTYAGTMLINIIIYSPRVVNVVGVY